MNKFITFEGCEASGKSTQAQLLYTALKKFCNKVILTREPGGTIEAEKIRELLISPNFQWNYKTEVLLHMAARNEHLQYLIFPNLKEDYFVICDRYIDSTFAYQGYGLGGKSTFINDIYEIIAGDFMPTLTFILNIEPSISVKRLKFKNNVYDRYETMDIEFHSNVHKGFLEIAKNNPKRCVVINGNDTIENVHNEIITLIKETYELDELLPVNADFFIK